MAVCSVSWERRCACCKIQDRILVAPCPPRASARSQPHPGSDRRASTKAGCAMLRLEAEAVIVELDGRGTPAASLCGRKWPCYAGATDVQDRFWRDGDLLMLSGTPHRALLFQKRASWASIWGMSVHPQQPEERACTVSIFGPKACRPARALPLIPGADLFWARCMLVRSTPFRHRDG